jgi:GntR family transcriptional repressor for pyruvate dehydrogenase complex
VSVDVRTPAYKLLADDLRAQITSGRLAPGDRLPTEPQLCQHSGLSRSTVREALRLLSSQHLIVTTRGVAGGSFVAHPSPDQIADTLATGVRLLQASQVVGIDELLETRACVEVPTAGFAALRRTNEQLEAIRAALFDPRTADLDEMRSAHGLFHEQVAAACGNPLLELISRPLFMVANAPRLLAQLDRDVWIEVDADHRAILAAIVDRDAARAQAAARRHIDNLRVRSTTLACDV